MLKSEPRKGIILGIGFALIFLWGGCWKVLDDPWLIWDHQVLDSFFRNAVEQEKIPPGTEDIVYLTFNDETFREFNKNGLDREDLASVISALSELFPKAVFFDLVFANAGDQESDQNLAAAMRNLDKSFLPVYFRLADKEPPMQVQGSGATILPPALSRIVFTPHAQKGTPNIPVGRTLVQQVSSIMETAFASGHINLQADEDGVFRRFPLMIMYNNKLFPSIALSLYMNAILDGPSEIEVEWGRDITIRPDSKNSMAEEIRIPIDDSGNTYLPYTRKWNSDHQEVWAHEFLKLFAEPEGFGILEQNFQDKIVLVSDVSQYAADIGKTPLEDRVPLVAVHAALINGFLENRFYSEWSRNELTLFFLVAGLAICLASLVKSFVPLLFIAAAEIFGTYFLAWNQFLDLKLMPVFSLMGGEAVLLGGLVVVKQICHNREKKFIRDAFSKYLPPKVINQIIEQPEKLELGGDTRFLTVLFSDVEGFTTISENLESHELVELLNEYLTEMTGIIMECGGIIDKFQGDAIMAEFGAPLEYPDHADKAVLAAIRMQSSLEEMRGEWAKKGKPPLKARIGINTGNMTVGNMGSSQAFDYTVMGDAVNLASRLEGANKVYGTRIMIGEITMKELTPGLFHTRFMDVIRVKGKNKAVKVYEVLGAGSESLSETDQEFIVCYEQGLNAYLKRDFGGSKKHFGNALVVKPEDSGVLQFIQRIDSINPEALPADWDGSTALTEK